jgi:hypothetical protein
MTIKVTDVYEAGCSEDGQTIRLNLVNEDGTLQWLELPAANVGKLYAGLIIAAQACAHTRAPITDMIGNGIELSHLIDPEYYALTSSPGLGFFALRLALAENVHLDFRLTLEQVDPMINELLRVAHLARSAEKPPGMQ